MVGILSDAGNVRDINEDNVGFYEDESKKIYIVADGMGGHNSGEVASKVAVEKVLEYIQPLSNIDDLKDVLEDAIDYANKEIFHLASKKPSYTGMGTTITVCLIVNKDMCVANVGDSSCYIIKDNTIIKATKDHSYVQQLIDNGVITEEEAINHPNKNIITRALGIKYSVKVDTYMMKLNSIKKVILCTDGLTNEMRENDIYNIVNKCNENNKKICEELIKEVKNRGARDNVSAIVFEGECEE